MKYIDKSLTNEQGYDVTCWIATQGDFDITSNMARLQISGYKDADAFRDGKPAAATKLATFSLSDLTTFEGVWAEIAGKLISTGGAFEGGTIEDTEEA